MVYVKGYYAKPSVLLAKGFALFTPMPAEVILGSEKVSLLHFTKRVFITNGYFSVDLQATDDDNVSSEPWIYFVQIFINGMKPVSFELNVPEASANIGIDLGNVSPEEESSGDLELGETSDTAYRGDRGKTAYDHTTLTNNPHSVTKSQVGLGSVDNTADSAKPISTLAQSALDLKADLVSGTVPSAQLPSFVDDVLEVANFAALPGTGVSGKIYVTIDDNKTFRWSGSVYVEISASLALGETSGSAYRGDRGKTAYDHSQLVSGNPHAVTKSDIGLGNVSNTSDVNKPVSTATQTALDTLASAPLSFSSQTTNYVLAATDHLKQVEWDKGTAGTITVPLNATVAIPVGFTTVCRQVGAGQITITPESGSVILQAPGNNLKTSGQYSSFVATKIATNTWAINGDLVA